MRHRLQQPAKATAVLPTVFLLMCSAAHAIEPAVPPDLSDLPLIEVPASGEATNAMGVFISGDGGWWTLDKAVSETLARHGISMVGVSSYRYFSKPRDPDVTAQDVARILHHYLPKWKKEKVVLVGYSFGADVMPFVATRLPDDLRARVQIVVLIGASPDATFGFHLTDWVRGAPSANHYPVQPEIHKLKGMKVLCIYGDKDKDCLCPKLDTDLVTAMSLPGDHHFAGDYKPIGEAIWKMWADK